MGKKSLEIEGKPTIEIYQTALGAGTGRPLARHSRWVMAGLLAVSDLVCLTLAWAAAIALRMALGPTSPFDPYFRLGPFLLVFVLVYAMRGLYPGVALSPVEELRLLVSTTSVIFLVFGMFAALTRSVEQYSRLVYLFAWPLTLVAVQGGRWLTRIVAVQLHLWGEPVAVIGRDTGVERVVSFLGAKMHLGLRPVLVINGHTKVEDGQEFMHWSYESPEQVARLLAEHGIQTAVVASMEIADELVSKLIDQGRLEFQRIILIPDLEKFATSDFMVHDLEGMLGLEVRQNLLLPGPRILKRTIDLLVVGVGGLPALPLMGLITLLVCLDSPGGAFFGQTRVGLGGRTFTMWKFRTMVAGAEAVLAQYLAENPEALAEWELNQKLKHDPRVTRMGYILRKYSLDELPQFWNVLVGEMSIVGPRPFFLSQRALYGEAYDVYTRVRPGITGLWQVSGRNKLDYDERIHLDEYYVRNWSIWLDIYILLRTGWVVLRGDGAY